MPNKDKTTTAMTPLIKVAAMKIIAESPVERDEINIKAKMAIKS